MINYYSLKKEEIFRDLNSSEKGLADSEVKERVKEFGKNTIKEKDKRTFIGILLSQFKSPLILILLFATIIAFALGEEVDAIIIFGIILISSLLGFYQEYKSDKALSALKKYITFKTKVLRDGEKTEVDVKDLVPGDIIFLNLGDVVPADLRIIESQELYANESGITGESYPVKKTDFEIEGNNISLTKQSNMLFMGSEISGGSCKGIVISTGENTEFGKTADILSSKEPPSDFQKGINNFGGFLIKLVFILTIFVFATNFFLGKGLFESFLFAIALAVGITPELLPVIMTISMSKGATKMAEKKVVVKKLVSIEDLGNMDTLCVDKTGTLTENKVSLTDYFDINNTKNEQIIQYAYICNSAVSDKHKAIGNQLDKTILEYVNEQKLEFPEYERIQEIEFDHERRRMSSIIKLENKKILICKGSPLSILDVCSKIKSKNKIEPIQKYNEEIKEKYEEISRKGLRVLALSYKEINNKKNYTIKDESDLIFLGFLVFLDPPKKDVKETLERFSKLGVEVKILTGDNQFVTEEICKKVGFKIKGSILTGEELEGLDEKEFLKVIEKNNIFARIVPKQKLKIIEGLKKNGHITGFLGDGVNDAPALKNCDVGITVDTAVDVAKNSADIILLKKSLGVISDGILEGRRTFGNSTKYILNTISANFGNMFSLSIASLYFNFIPLLPKQVLLTNFISDVPLLAISSDNVDEQYLKKPNKWNIKMIRRFMIFFGIISSIFDIVTMMLVWFFISPGNPAMFRTVWFTESVLSEIIVTFAIRTKKPFWKSKPSKLLVLASVFGVALTLFAVLSKFKGWFGFEDITIIALAIIGSILFSYFVLVEIGKKIFYSKIEKKE
jgi:Mg2+-importing ATPase